ncbi:hypothetical protein F444_05793, partial [Phytophthora nicotianae P1976]
MAPGGGIVRVFGPVQAPSAVAVTMTRAEKRARIDMDVETWVERGKLGSDCLPKNSCGGLAQRVGASTFIFL